MNNLVLVTFIKVVCGYVTNLTQGKVVDWVITFTDFYKAYFNIH